MIQQTSNTTFTKAPSLKAGNQLDKSPLVHVKAVHLTKPNSLTDKENYRFYSQDLSTSLLEEVIKFYPNYSITLSGIQFKYYDLERNFDQVVCRIVQGDNSTCFYVQTSFFLESTLVASAEQSFLLYSGRITSICSC